MKLIGLMPVRNEAWCLGLSLRVALMWCDAVVLLFHECTDESLSIVADVFVDEAPRLFTFSESGPWDEMRHRQMMLELARKHGATHIAMIDADEVC